MAGHGGGRGRRMMSFSVEAIGINRGESLPPSIQQPTPLFPLMEHKPLPLTEGEEAEYLLALKQEFRGTTRSLPSFIHPAATKRDVERYSDKYHGSEQTDRLRDAIPDWTRFPKEIRPYLRKLKRAAPPAKTTEPLVKKTKTKDKEDVLLQLETLEKKEQQQSDEEEADGEEEGKKQEEEGAEAEEEYDEEEFEEETDYIMSYFDNGEEFGAESDDNMDEAVY